MVSYVVLIASVQLLPCRQINAQLPRLLYNMTIPTVTGEYPVPGPSLLSAVVSPSSCSPPVSTRLSGSSAVLAGQLGCRSVARSFCDPGEPGPAAQPQADPISRLAPAIIAQGVNTLGLSRLTKTSIFAQSFLKGASLRRTEPHTTSR